MSKNGKEILAVCPNCNGIIFRKGELGLEIAKITFKGMFSFLTKCPHCGKKVKVKFEIKTQTEQVYDNN